MFPPLLIGCGYHKSLPHPAGPSKCRSLKALAKEFLNRDIQAKESGHDSKEDAIAALDLMKFKTEQMRIWWWWWWWQKCWGRW